MGAPPGLTKEGPCGLRATGSPDPTQAGRGREVRPGQGQSEGTTSQQSPVIAGPVNYDSMRGIRDVSLPIVE